MALTQRATELPKGQRDYAGIVAEAEADAGEFVELLEDDLTAQQAADAGAHLRKHYADKHNLTVLVRARQVYIRANK